MTPGTPLERSGPKFWSNFASEIRQDLLWRPILVKIFQIEVPEGSRAQLAHLGTRPGLGPGAGPGGFAESLDLLVLIPLNIHTPKIATLPLQGDKCNLPLASLQRALFPKEGNSVTCL